ncbi:hypothetical protein F5Y12DRAFT_744067 [Xylaria sp. FL1777]|nr:hypothetical protein F5Y12DRAFT_744067 [Xylaria sp. FL1777]
MLSLLNYSFTNGSYLRLLIVSALLEASSFNAADQEFVAKRDTDHIARGSSENFAKATAVAGWKRQGPKRVIRYITIIALLNPLRSHYNELSMTTSYLAIENFLFGGVSAKCGIALVYRLLHVKQIDRAIDPL